MCSDEAVARVTVGRSAVVVAVLAATALAGCRPPPPRPAIAVTTSADGADANPGDGVCEVTPGAGDCSLSAAVDEGNALGRAAITVPAGRYEALTTATLTLTVTGDLTINDGSPADVELVNHQIAVAAGGRLSVDGLSGFAFAGPRITVHGSFRGRHLSLVAIENVEPILAVEADGVASVEQSFLVNSLLDGSPAVRNRGTLAVRYATVATYVLATPALITSVDNTGVLYAEASILAACTGTPPVSLGANAAIDESCGLDEPDDRRLPVDVAFDFGPPVVPVFAAASPVVDAIAAGSHGCGTTVVDDMVGDPRPADGNGDGVAACDIGSRERPVGP